MKKKTLKIVAIVVGVLLLFIAGIALFILSIKKDQKATVERVQDVINVYSEFSDSVDKFNDIRNELYFNTLDNVYITNIGEMDSTIQVSFKKYEETVDEVNKVTDKLSKLCGNIYFTDSRARTKCESYASVYEQIVNAFVSDVKSYNKNIDEYNDYQKGLNTNISLKHYDTTKKYIDYNNDKKYEGKEE